MFLTKYCTKFQYAHNSWLPISFIFVALCKFVSPGTIYLVHGLKSTILSSILGTKSSIYQHNNWFPFYCDRSWSVRKITVGESSDTLSMNTTRPEPDASSAGRLCHLAGCSRTTDLAFVTVVLEQTTKRHGRCELDPQKLELLTTMQLERISHFLVSYRWSKPPEWTIMAEDSDEVNCQNTYTYTH